jgi:hypothetical protein
MPGEFGIGRQGSGDRLLAIPWIRR